MIKTPLSTVIGGAFWTPGCTVIGGSAPNFDQYIHKLFANGEQGFFYDPNDLSTMFQDSMGAVPVTGTGQPVGLIRDKSGNNNHAFQTTSASRPILRKNAVTGANYLEFDGVDDFLWTNSIDFRATDKVSLFTGVVKLSDEVLIIAELSLATEFNDGSFFLWSGDEFDDTGVSGYLSLGRGSAEMSVDQVASNSIYPSPDVAVLSIKHDISGDLSSMRRNGVVGVDGLGDKGEGNFGNYPLLICGRANARQPFSGHVYALIGVGKLTLDDEMINIEKELAKRTGVTLNV